MVITTVGPLNDRWNPDPYVKSWFGKEKRAAHSTSGMASKNSKKDSNYDPSWKANNLMERCCEIFFSLFLLI